MALLAISVGTQNSKLPTISKLYSPFLNAFVHKARTQLHALKPLQVAKYRKGLHFKVLLSRLTGGLQQGPDQFPSENQNC